MDEKSVEELSTYGEDTVMLVSFSPKLFRVTGLGRIQEDDRGSTSIMGGKMNFREMIKIYEDLKRKNPHTIILVRRRIFNYLLQDDTKKNLYKTGKISGADVSVKIKSWAAHASWADTYGLRKKIFGELILKRAVPEEFI